MEGRAALLAALALLLGPAGGSACGFEDVCHWGWNNSRVVTGQEVNNSWVPGDSALQGPFADLENNTHGHFLYTYLKQPGPRELHIWSRGKYGKPSEQCRLIFWYHMHNMSDGHIRVIMATNNTQFIVSERFGNDDKRWQNYSVNLGGIKQEFSIILEFVPGTRYPLHIAVDNILLNNCFPDPPQNVCQPSQFQCSNGTCIDGTQVCNINRDCEDGEDETREECGEVPEFARCTFEEGWCGWHNGHGTQAMNWTLNNGSTTPSTGPTTDNTYRNSTGVYVLVEMTRSHSMGAAAILESPIIYPPPKYHSNVSSLYYNSCYITFFYHKVGPNSGSLGVFLVELQENANRTSKIWWNYGDRGNKWLRNIVILPNITNRYFLQFEARKSFTVRGDPAIDDISMSPKCFGIGVPKEHLDGYDYNNPFSPYIDPTPPPTTHLDFINSTYYKFTTCGASGRYGPTQEECDVAYNNTGVNVTVQTQKTMAGIQQWIVPESGFYTIIAKGASGGRGSDGNGFSWGAMVKTVMELTKGTKVYILVGQEGNPACLKTFASNKKTVCQGRNTSKKALKEKLKEISDLLYLPEGGGGGGGTFIFTWSKEKRPLVIAGGGGGLAHKTSHNPEPDSAIQHGKMMNGTLPPTTGEQYGTLSGGAGGGWNRANYIHSDATGFALLQGGIGGSACYESNDGSDKGAGGFGGGGGGCTAGGGGGGYTGGRAWSQKGSFGEGGYSWITRGMMQKVRVPGLTGPGEVHFIPATYGCGCAFRCVALDVHRSKVLCICPEGWHVANDSTSCLQNNPNHADYSVAAFIVCVFAMVFGVLIFFLVLYSRYRKKKDDKARRQMVTGADLQLNRLRVASDSMMTEYNPNYEFGGGVYSLRDLKEIPREHLRLVKALGQGAFGEVYQGFFKHRAGDAVEMPVAVKTLPELSTNQAETDFLMEALIMSKFNHPNIVHFIGVCFDKHPRFIVIELLAGGDLKTFLRESRPKPDRASPLTMKDLLTCIVDVAKGCKYMEDNRFIHRDIAARNCLLTTKGPGRVVKIADFGMARDIYRADYYRKGGKAMLPIKWMPPEAFLDGIFTTKTDVWSFGVLMWEVMSLGYMPYTGCANREVMQLVTSGGRLEPPTNCPSQLYAIMTQCWHPNPDERPSFSLILERLGYCLQDPDVIRAPLPVYAKPPSSERDTTIMRPTGQDECIQPDYLVPLSGPLQEWEGFGNHLPESRSTQPLLENSSSSGAGSPATNNNNPLSTIPEKPFHSNHIHPGQEIFTVSSTLKAETEISC